MKTYNKTQDYKNRLKFALILIVIGWVAMWLTSCNEEEEPPVPKPHASLTPPVNLVNMRIELDLPSSKPNGYENLKTFTVVAKRAGYDDDAYYHYTATNPTLRVSTQGTITTFIIESELTKQGSKTPEDYKEESDKWVASCEIGIEIKVDTKTFDCTYSKLEISALPKWRSEIDNTSFVYFADWSMHGGTGNEWSITSELGNLDIKSNITIAINDVYGTDFKN